MIGAGGGAGGVKGVFRTWNWPHMPVRIFTYRVGGDATAGHNMKDMACTNKGKVRIIFFLSYSETTWMAQLEYLNGLDCVRGLKVSKCKMTDDIKKQTSALSVVLTLVFIISPT